MRCVRVFKFGLLIAFSSGLMGSAVFAAPDPDAISPVEINQSVAHAVSRPLRELGRVSAPGMEHKREKPLRLIPLAPGQQTPDPIVQSTPGPSVSTSAGLNLAGVGNGDYGFAPDAAPPDTNLDVSATQIVQWVNESLIIFDKSKNVLSGPVTGNSIFKNMTGAGSPCATTNDGDPIVKYDRLAKRWILTQFVVSVTPYLQCVAVSTGDDATGPYYLYAFNYGTQFPDYPKLGVWPDAYYITYNIFNGGSSFAGAKLCAFDRSSMLAGKAATQQCFQLSSSYGGVLPADLDGTSLPLSGASEPFINFGSNSLNIWRFHVDWTNTAKTVLTGPLKLSVAAFSPACGGGSCIPQPGTSTKLDSLADRLMYRFAYRASVPTPLTNVNQATVQDAAVVNHSVTAGGTRQQPIIGVRWYQLLNLTSGTPAVYQQGTFAPDSTARWMGSIAMDKLGDIALGYSASSSSVNPSLRYTGRLASASQGTMQSESVLLNGGGAQTGNLNRWGDYSAMAVDPSDDCTFYYTNEYLKTSGSFNWSTWISAFKFPGCK